MERKNALAIFFSHPADFREWLEQNHETETELLVGFYKKGSGQPSMTWSQSVDEALCFGWIDGRLKSLDKDRYQIRFTPRRRGSIWSRVNIRKVETLTQEGRMQEAGLAAFEAREESKSEVYAFEQAEISLLPQMEAQFKADKTAWQYFEALVPSYRKTSLYWVMSAKGEDTRQKRLAELIADSAAGTNRWKDNKYKK